MDIKKLFVVLVAFVLLAPTVIAADLGAKDLGSTVYAQVLEDGKTIEASLLVFDAGTTPTGVAMSQALRDIMDDCKNEADIQRCVYDKSRDLYDEPPEFEPTTLQYASFIFSYYNPTAGSFTPITGCEFKNATEQRDIPTDITGESRPYYYTTCEVPSDLVSSYPRLTIKVEFIPQAGQDVKASVSQYITLENAQVTETSVFVRAINEVVDKFRDEGSRPVCIGIFLLMGLLLASFYFSGRSPLTLLDITTPKLPAPKGAAISGQIVAPFGYGELKKATAAKMTSAIKAADATRKALTRGGAGVGAAARRAEQTIADIKATAADRAVVNVKGEKAILKSIAAGAASMGMAWPSYAALLKKLPKNYGDAEHKMLAQVLAQLREKGGERGVFLAGTIQDYFFAHAQNKHLNVLLGITSEEGKTNVMYARTMGLYSKIYGRYGLVGTSFAAVLGSMRRTAEMGKRGVKATAAYTAAAAAGAARKMIGEKKYLRLKKRAAVSPAAAAVAGLLAKRTPSEKIGQMFPIVQKMAFLYGSLRNEMRKDQMRYLIAQLYKSVGVKFNISMEEIESMGYVDMDMLKRMNIKDNAALKKLEGEINRILSDSGLSAQQKIAALAALAKSRGVAIDNNMLMVGERLEEIDRSSEPEYMKLMKLNGLLEAEHNRAKGIMQGAGAENAYICYVGLENPTGSQFWEMHVVRGGLNEAVFDIEKSAARTHLTMINDLRTLWVHKDQVGMLPEHMRNAKEQEAINKRVLGYLGLLITDKGKRVLYDLTGKTTATAGIGDYLSVLYGQKAMYKKAGIVEGPGGVDMIEGKGVWFEAPKEIAPLAGAWKIDMKRAWVAGLDPRESQSAGEWVENRFKRGYHTPYRAPIEAMLNRMGLRGEERAIQAKKLWVADLLRQNLNQSANSLFEPNAYGRDTGETIKSYSFVVAGNLARTLKEKGLAENHPDRVFVGGADVGRPKDNARLLGILAKNRKEFEEVSSRDITYNDVAKGGPMVMFHGGGYAYYRPGMLLNDRDRVLGGTVSLRDSKGQWRAFDPNNVVVEKGFGNRNDLLAEYSRARGSKNTRDWDTVVDSASRWVNEGGYSYERQKVYASLLWQRGMSTGDYNPYWHNSNVQVVSTRETMPLVPPSVAMLGVEEAPRISKAIKPFRDFRNHLGNYISEIALATGGPVHDASYGIISTSEMLRQRSTELATKIYSSDMKGLTEQEKVAYRNVAIQHGAYHQVWSFCVDRNPWVASSAYGSYADLSAYYHYGPIFTFDTRTHARAYMKSRDYGSFMAFYGWPINAAGRMMRPYTTMIRSLQMSVHGYPSKWDTSDNPMSAWKFTPPRFLESMQAVNPFSFSGVKFRRVSSLNVWGGSLEKRQLAGPDFAQGLSQSPWEIFGQHKGGARNTARWNTTNPGLSYSNYRNETLLDPAQGEYLWRSAQATYVHDERIKRQAFSDINRRTIRAEALAMKREEELRGYGLSQNPLYGWASPLTFAYHLPLPFIPPSFAPRSMIANAASSYKYGGRSFMQSLAELKRKTGGALSRFAQPWRGANVAYCPICHTPGYHGGNCKNPQCGHYIY